MSARNHEIVLSMPMYLTTLSKKGFAMVYLGFLALFAVSVIVGAAGPAVFQTFSFSTKGDASLDMSRTGTRFNWDISGLTKLNQELWFTIRAQSKLSDTKTVGETLNVSLVLEGNKGGEEEWTWVAGGSIPRYLTCVEGREFCEDMVVFDLRYVKFNAYRVQIEFLNDENDIDFIGDCEFVWTTMNQKFTLFELWFRFTFLVFSFAGLFLFVFRLRTYKLSDWSLEQRWICVLLVTLMGYDNPLFPTQILLDTWLPAFIDALLTSSFIASLFLFWLCYFDGIRKTSMKRTARDFYAPKLLLVFVIWVTFVIIFSWQVLHQLDNPTYSYVYNNPFFVFFVVVAALLGIVYTIWFMYVIIRAYNDRASLPLLQVQLVFMGCLTLLVFGVMILGLAFGFYGVVENSAAQFLSLYSLFNLYVLSLAVVWSPSGPASKDGESHGPMARLEDSDEGASPAAATARTGPSATSVALTRRGDFSSSEEDERPSIATVKSGSGTSVSGSATGGGGGGGGGGGASSAPPPKAAIVFSSTSITGART